MPPWRLPVCLPCLAHRAGRPGHVCGCAHHPWWGEALSGTGRFWQKPRARLCGLPASSKPCPCC